MGNLFRWAQFGHEIRQATGVKWAQAIVITLAMGYWAAKSFGFAPDWSEDQLFSVLGFGGSLFGLFATFATTRRIGIGRRRVPPTYYDEQSEFGVSGIPDEYVPSNSGSSFDDRPFLRGDY